MKPNAWSTLTASGLSDLEEARLVLHHAAQPLAAAAYALLPAPADHSHSNLLWSAERAGFVGRALPSGGRAFLDPETLRIGLLSPGGEPRTELEVVGRTLTQLLDDLALALREAGEAVPARGLQRPDYELPPSALADGAAFPAPAPAALTELAHWFANGAATLEALAAAHLEQAEVRGWPHHFDLAALLTLDPDRDPEHARSLGVGLSPGDEHYAEPYFYVSPWPAPERRHLPSLPPGAHWHTAGFTSAILPASAIVTAESAEAQQARSEGALDAIVRSALLLLRA